MNAAICPLVMWSPGQNMLLSGGLQPMVIPHPAMMSMFSSWTFPSSSRKRPSQPPMTLTRYG